MRVETKCPCCDKRIYVDVNVSNADIVDIVEESEQKREDEYKRKQDKLRAKDPELYAKAMAECEKIMKGIMEG